MSSLMAGPPPIIDRPSAPVGGNRLDGPDSDGRVAVADLGRILWRRRWWVCGSAVLLAAAALIYSLLTPPQYAATAEILVDPRDRVIVANDVNPSALPPDGGLAQVESQARVIGSSSVLQRAVESEGLADDPDFGRKTPLFDLLNAKLKALGVHLGTGSTADTANTADERALAALRRRLTIKRADKVFVIDITVKARSALQAARIVNTIADAYLADQASARAAAGERASASLAARLSEQKKRVNDAENAVERYKAQNAIVASNGILVGDQQLTDINGQLAAARSRTAELRSRVDQIEAARRGGTLAGATVEALNSTVISQLRARDAELTQKEADLLTQLGPRHPAIASVRSQVQELRQLIGAELDRIARAARADYDRARANEAALGQRMQSRTDETLATRQASVRLRELERDVEAARTVYATFMLRAQETREQASIDTTNARIITRATPPLERSWPPTVLLVLGAFAGGLGLAAAGAFFAEYSHPSILSREQLRETLGLTVIEVSLPRRRRRWLRGLRRRPPRRADGAGLDPLLRRVLSGGRRSTEIVHGILLTGGPGGERLSHALAESLGVAADTTGERVLLVEAGLGAGENLEASGLLDVLRGELPLDAAMKRRPGSGVMALPLGRQRTGLADWRQSRSATWLFAQAARRFDLMIVDGGTAGVRTRTGPLFADCDEAIVVVEKGESLRRDALEAVEGLRAMGARPTAAVLVTRRGHV